MPEHGGDVSGLIGRLVDGVDRVEKKLDRMDRTLRGGNGNDIGLLGEHHELQGQVDRQSSALEALRFEMKDELADIRAHLKLKMFPQSDDAASMKTRAEAWAIRIAAIVALGGFAIDIYQKLTGG